jgi:hypothetical protein
MAALTQRPIQLRRLKAEPCLINNLTTKPTNKLTECGLGRAVNCATQRAGGQGLGLCRVDGLVFD